MKQVRIQGATIQTQNVNFAGGLDLTTPVNALKPGNALEAMNYEPGLNGGYRRIDGFERFDGKPAPSAATYLYLEGAFPGAVAVGNAVVGSTSGAGGIVVHITPGGLAVSKVSGQFVAGEQIRVGANPVGQLSYAPSPRGIPDAYNDAVALAAAADLYRLAIQAVPGEGPIRGVWMHKGVVYAFRDNVGKTECCMYATSNNGYSFGAGWGKVALGFEIDLTAPNSPVYTGASNEVYWTAHGQTNGSLVRFSGPVPSGIVAGTAYYVVNASGGSFSLSASKGGAVLPIGQVGPGSGLVCQGQAKRINELEELWVNSSGGYVKVMRVAVRSGAWDSFDLVATASIAVATANGQNAFTGTLPAGDLWRTGLFGTPKVSTLSASKAITLKPGGRFEFVSANFYGSLDTYRMYFCDGVNRAFEFEGPRLNNGLQLPAVCIPINTGMAVDTPNYITVHKKKLFLSFGASVQYSGDGTPYQWTILSGANEIGVGDAVTGMIPQAGDTLAIFTRSSSYQLNGSTNNSFQLLPIAAETGAIGRTVQVVGRTLALDDRGIVTTDRTQTYGNFVQASISTAVQPLIDKLRGRILASSVYRSRGQYRLYASQGEGLIVGFNDQGVIGITQFKYPTENTPVCVASCEDATGKDVVFFGDSNGMVYQADVGSSFDGQPIESYVRLPFNNISNPRNRKRFRKAIMDMAATAYAAIRFQPEFSFSDPDIGTHRLQTAQGSTGVEVGGTGGYWDFDNWDEFAYDARLVSSPEFGIEGTGLSLSVTFYSSSAIDLGHVLQGMVIHYSLRRLSR